MEIVFPYISPETASSELASFIPSKDRKRLEYFFRRLVLWDNCGYVLLGEKPCITATFQEPLHLRFFTPSNWRFWLGWKTWKKYEKFFPHPAFSILKERRQDGTSLLIFINKSEFIHRISTYKTEFESILEYSIEPNHILIEAESKPLMSQILQNNDFLIGLILGYGRYNSWMYSQTDMHDHLKMGSFIEPEESSSFANWISSCGIWGFTSGSLFRDISKLQLPGFKADPNTLETIQLKEKYSATRQKIIKYYDQRNFLDTTLALLMTPFQG